MHDAQIVLGPENEEKTVLLFGHPSADGILGIEKRSLGRIGADSIKRLEQFDLSYDTNLEPDGYEPPPELMPHAPYVVHQGHLYLVCKWDTTIARRYMYVWATYTLCSNAFTIALRNPERRLSGAEVGRTVCRSCTP